MSWRLVAGVALGLAVLVVALPWISPLLGFDDHRQAIPPPTRRVEIGDGRYLNVVDRGTGPPIVLVHGLPGDAAQLGPLAEALSARGLRSITFDRLGWGYSSRRPASRPANALENARDFVALLDALGLERASWLGYSYGGGVVLRAVQDHPERTARLVLLSSVGPAQARPAPGALERLLFSPPVLRWALSTRATARALSAGAMRTLFAPEVDPPPAVVDRMLGFASLPGVPTTWVREARAPRSYGTDPIAVPTLIIHGDGDQAVPVAVARDLHARFPRSRLVVIPGGSHALPLTRPGEIADAVSAFLRSGPSVARSGPPAGGTSTRGGYRLSP